MFIIEYPYALASDFCNSLIQKFEKDSRKKQGEIAGGVDLNIKNSTDLHISKFKEYGEEDGILYNSLNPRLQDYFSRWADRCNFLLTNSTDSGFQIQKTLPEHGYTWHHDFLIESGRVRYFTYLWYLNTVEKGGETEFITGDKVKPEQGKLIIFPATWNFGHRGVPPERETKYICTGWLYGEPPPIYATDA